MFNKYLLASLVLMGTSLSAATIFADASSQYTGLTSNWNISGSTSGATVQNISDSERGKAFKLVGNGLNTTFSLGNQAGRANNGAWNDTLDKTIKWSMKYSEKFTVMVAIKTQNGNRFLVYTNEGTSKKGKIRGGKVRYGLGADSADGSWHTFTRDLEADWSAYEPNNPIISVNGFFVKGSGEIDDIIGTTGQDTQPPLAPTNLTVSNTTQTSATISWDNNSSNVDGFNIYDDNDPVASFRRAPANATSIDLTGLTPNKTYTYIVEAENSAGSQSTAITFKTANNSVADNFMTYENAEDASTSRWTISGNSNGADVINTEVAGRSRAIELIGNGLNTTFRLGNQAGRANNGAWNDSVNNILQWSMNFSEKFNILVAIKTQNGNRFLVYTNDDTSKKGKIRGGKVRYGLGTDSSDGNWHTFTRDLAADWSAYEPNNPIISVNGFFVKGSGMIDDVIAKSKYKSKVKKTGQTTSYHAKDDGDYEEGISPSYTRDDATSIVTDTTTGLQWQDNQDAKNLTMNASDDANNYCRSLNLGAYSDWRVPTVKELSSIIDYGRSPSINSTFKNTASSMYWTNKSDTNQGGNYYVTVNFANGVDSNSELYQESHNVRCVRGDSNLDASPEFVNRGDYVIDNKTNLAWQNVFPNNSAKNGTWAEAIEYCSTLNINGTGWRLPNANELNTILTEADDASSVYSEIDIDPDYSLWTSTTYAGNTNSAYSYWDSRYIQNKNEQGSIICVKDKTN